MGGSAAPQESPAGVGRPGSGGGISGRLRAGDPPRVGEYELVTLLGEGGMGRVYLARSPAGRLVAVKLIRTDVAEREMFRRRFRGEVARARQVPPFCTAEVLDADPDHDPPYLVVEYVDGPDLATVVRERGPLSPANLHGLAIGVATALTAIHGAGVIHRDLKAANVLLAPGSPKVIDFGLAQVVDPMRDPVGDTTTGEVVGTVAYMAPERIEPAGRELTPAADIFSWGAVIAFAGTGTVPFAADSLPALATRILTEPPDLDGLSGDLRELVAQALAKDPADRPTARELLDRLLATRDGDGSPAPAGRTELMRTGRRYAQVDPDDPGIPTTAYPIPTATVAARARRPRTRLLLVALGGILMLGAVAGLVILPARTPAGPSGPVPSAVATSPAPALIPAGTQLVVRDPLAAPGRWEYTTHEAGTTCEFAGELVVTSQIPSFRCRGPADELADLALQVDVTLLEPGSCATVWFRFTVAAGGYALRVCEEAYYLVTHGTPEPHTVNTLREFWFDAPLAGPARVGIAAESETLRFYRDGELVGSWSDDAFDRGRVGLGVLQMRPEVRPPYRVSFANVEVWGSGG